MPRHYPAELRRKTCARMLAGEAVKDLAEELGIGFETLYRWRRQALIDADLRPGAKSHEVDPLCRAAGGSKNSKPNSKPNSRRPRRRPSCSRRAPSTQKEVPGCP